jgi:hypothetical protein
MMHLHLFLVEPILFLDIDENDSRTRLRKRDASEDERETNETKESKAKKNETKKNERNDSTNDEIAL